MDEKQLEEFVSTGTVKRPVSLLAEGIKAVYIGVPADASDMECWEYFLHNVAKDPAIWTYLAPALVIADAIRSQTRTLDLIYKGGIG